MQNTVLSRHFGKIIVAVIVIGATAYFLFSGKNQQQQQGQNQMPALPVTVAQPLKKEVMEWDEFTGRFEAVETVDVRARVGGYLGEIHFKEGTIVKKGDLLFVVDPRPYAANLKQAEADVKAAEAKVEFTNLELKRAAELVKTKSIADRILDERRQQNLDAKAQLESTKAKVERAKLDLEFTQVVAPIAGRVSARNVTEGNLITGGTADSTMLTTIVSLDPIHFYFDVDEQSYLKYQRLAQSGERPSGRESPNPVNVALMDEKEYTHEGKMDFVDNRIDQSSGTMRGRAVFGNNNMILIPGMFGRARIMGSGKYEAMLIPDDAVATDQARKFVLAVDEEGNAIPKTVTLGPIIDGLRVVRGGLDGSEWIIIKGMQRARPGAKVAPEKSTLADMDNKQ